MKQYGINISDLEACLSHGASSTTSDMEDACSVQYCFPDENLLKRSLKRMRVCLDSEDEVFIFEDESEDGEDDSEESSTACAPISTAAGDFPVGLENDVELVDTFMRLTNRLRGCCQAEQVSPRCRTGHPVSGLQAAVCVMAGQQ
ncbi:hypothetical protein GUITHDRAFT_102063 [Guillardia theta CCMP2712]|uniref:Uncharacterized protein n=1 Tax=Guillardia theta (strain CCMP2712) TaxID=905079 RepID=L1JUB1_GUITC|nr:hypothetical protein GUITHDRAFT_102063 [Guillardia theta CCMP2712]EKX52161.1 hypothetical protein GUITHDRAFT_102063 [Guillardia theta CCMP2712]|eukprot:XP_005839141.1 hypothetical protein GUITHDRAFT_102063 [Guillardia theta CCMP2712]